MGRVGVGRAVGPGSVGVTTGRVGVGTGKVGSTPVPVGVGPGRVGTTPDPLGVGPVPDAAGVAVAPGRGREPGLAWSCDASRVIVGDSGASVWGLSAR